jgi:hypothetical protein
VSLGEKFFWWGSWQSIHFLLEKKRRFIKMKQKRKKKEKKKKEKDYIYKKCTQIFSKRKRNKNKNKSETDGCRWSVRWQIVIAVGHCTPDLKAEDRKGVDGWRCGGGTGGGWSSTMYIGGGWS